MASGKKIYVVYPLDLSPDVEVESMASYGWYNLHRIYKIQINFSREWF